MNIKAYWITGSMVLACAAGVARAQTAAALPARGDSAVLAASYTEDGKLRMPADYREWIFLSSGLDMSYSESPSVADHSMFDNVFSDPASYQAGGVMGIEIHVKDSKRFAGGWAFFGFEGNEPAKARPASEACYSCHLEHGAVDTTFVQFYPTLLEIATKKGTLATGAKH